MKAQFWKEYHASRMVQPALDAHYLGQSGRTLPTPKTPTTPTFGGRSREESQSRLRSQSGTGSNSGRGSETQSGSGAHAHTGTSHDHYVSSGSSHNHGQTNEIPTTDPRHPDFEKRRREENKKRRQEGWNEFKYNWKGSKAVKGLWNRIAGPDEKIDWDAYDSMRAGFTPSSHASEMRRAQTEVREDARSLGRASEQSRSDPRFSIGKK